MEFITSLFSSIPLISALPEWALVILAALMALRWHWEWFPWWRWCWFGWSVKFPHMQCRVGPCTWDIMDSADCCGWTETVYEGRHHPGYGR